MDKRSLLTPVLCDELLKAERRLLEFEVIKASSLFTSDQQKAVAMHDAYGSFILHLYSFYEGICEFQGVKWKLDEVATESIAKTYRFRMAPKVGIKDAEKLNVPADIGKHFRLTRNTIGHVKEQRVQQKDDFISLQEFYKRYHQYIYLMLDQALFSWRVSVETFDFGHVGDLQAWSN